MQWLVLFLYSGCYWSYAVVSIIPVQASEYVTALCIRQGGHCVHLESATSARQCATQPDGASMRHTARSRVGPPHMHWRLSVRRTATGACRLTTQPDGTCLCATQPDGAAHRCATQPLHRFVRAGIEQLQYIVAQHVCSVQLRGIAV